MQRTGICQSNLSADTPSAISVNLNHLILFKCDVIYSALKSQYVVSVHPETIPCVPAKDVGLTTNVVFNVGLHLVSVYVMLMILFSM
jgi:hypothetical protein